MKVMKTMYKTVFFLSLIAAFLTACEKEEVNTIISEENIEIIPELAGMYVTTPGNWSSATRAIRHPKLEKITNLPEGSTLRLIAKKEGRYVTTETKDYVVRTADGGAQSLYPCTLNEDGSIKSEDKKPLYLTAGTYTFSAVSPAYKYDSRKGMTIDNGESVVATNNCWTQTSASKITIAKDDKSKIIPLNPLMQLTARMTFTLKGGEGSGVSSLSVMQDGIEIDRIRQNPVKLDNVGDSIAAVITDNYNRIYIKDIKILDDGSLRGEVCLLPIDNRPTPMTVILNLLVNNVPTQFTFSIVNKVLYAGYSYDYKVTIKIKDNITVANWQETSWSTTVSGGGTVD